MLLAIRQLFITYLEENNFPLAFIHETWLKQTEGAIVTSIKAVGYNIRAFIQNININKGGEVDVLYKNNLILSNKKLTTKYF